MVRVWPDPDEPSVKAPVLLKVVAEPMVELLLAKPRTNSNAVLAVFKVVAFTEPEMEILPVWLPEVKVFAPVVVIDA
jgi:hypothetical protein